MALREELRTQVADKIEAEAIKQRQEVGLCCDILHVRAKPGDLNSPIVAYRITVSTDNGMTHTFPDIPASRRPTPDETQALIQEYQNDFVDAIRARRAERRAAKL